MTPEQWSRLDDLFQAAIEMPAVERTTFLDTLAREDAGLSREVASLVEAHQQAEGFLSLPGIVHDKVPGPPPGGAPSIIGPYRIEREIGSGGMGTVYAASRADAEFERRVALKLVRSAIANESMLARFRAERQILATLEHPNIARLLDGGTTPDGQPFLVTELIEGAPLQQYCAARRLGMEARLDLFSKLCSAVQYAHEHLIIHRDLKPGNILVDQRGEPKLLDFGIAKSVDPSGRTELTQTVSLLTPRYASPEQLSGASITTATDIYSLGVILYELLAGRHPFEHELKDRAGMRQATLEREPVPPSRFRKNVSGDLDNIVLMALRKNPERRYRSAAQLADDLKRYRHNQPVIARKETLVYVLWKFFLRHRLAGLAGAAAFAALAAGLGVTVYEARIATRERMKAEFIENFVKSTLSGADPTYNSPFADKGRDLRVADVIDVAVQRARLELSKQPLLQGELLRDLGDDYSRLGLYEEAAQALRDALVDQENTLGPHAGPAELTRRALGEILRHLSQSPKAESGGAAKRPF